MDQAATGPIQACCRYHHEPLSDSHRDGHAGRDGGHDGGHDGGRGGCGRGRDGLDGRDDRWDSFFQCHLCGQSWYHRLLRRLHRPPWNCLHRPPWSRLHCLPGHGPQRRTRNIRNASQRYTSAGHGTLQLLRCTRIHTSTISFKFDPKTLKIENFKKKNVSLTDPWRAIIIVVGLGR